MSGIKRSLVSRLSFIQARNCVIVAFIVGMLLSVAQIAVDYSRETDSVESFANEVLEASKFAAADATFHLDAPAAQEVVRGVLQYYSIVHGTIRDEEGMVLATLGKERTETTDDARYRFFGENKTFSSLLQLKTGELLGTLEIVVDPVLAAQGFMDRSMLVIAAGVVRNFLLSFILIFLITTQTKPTFSSLSGIGGVLRQT